MTEFFETHRQDIIYGIIVIIAVVVLRLLTNKLHYWLAKEKQRKFPGETIKPLNLLKRILNSLWIILGVIALSYLFVENENKGIIIDNFKTVLYIGVVISITIIVATSASLWFKIDIQKKIESEHDPTSFKFLRYVVLVGIYFIGFMLCLLAFPTLKGVAQTALGVQV